LRAIYTPEQQELEKTMLAVAADGLSAARECLSSGWVAPPCDERLVADYAGLGVPEEAGGVGGTLVDVAIAVGALARTLLPTTLVTHWAAVQVALAAGLDVRAAAAGEQRWALADRPTLVPGGGADAAVVVVDGRVGLDAAPQWRFRESIDKTRPYADLTSTPVEGHLADAGDGMARATVVAAADLAGAAYGAVELGARYAGIRKQFGRPIGELQGVAFALADAFVAATAAWDLTLYAAWATDSGAADAATAVHAAKAKAGEAAIFAAERTMQVFGGLGMTAEADPHLYLRRALAGDAWLGSARWHHTELGRMRLLLRD